MYLTSIRVQGLRGAEDFEAAPLERVVQLPSGPPGVAVADGLSMFAAALDRSQLTSALVGLELGDPKNVQILEEDGFPTQLTLPDAFGVAPLLPGDGSRQVMVTVELELDPPMFGRLRQLAVRDPRLVTALGAGARVTVKVGWLFTNDLTTASISVLAVAVGETPFAVSGSDRPPWLGGLLREIGQRFRRVGRLETTANVARRLLEASLSLDPERRSRFRRVAERLGEPPFSLGRLELVQVSDQVEACFGPGLARARQYGAVGADALRLVEAVLLEAPDVLVVESGAEHHVLVRGWLEEQVVGERATLEQVIVVPGGVPDLAESA